MDKKLKLIVDHEPWVDIPIITKLEDVPRKERDNNSWWYLHGELDEFVGYDKATAVNCFSIGVSKETLNWSSICGNKVEEVFDEEPYYRMHLNGTIPVEIEGVDKECIGYFWTTDEHDIYYKDKAYPFWWQRGLVCFVDDTEACAYAQEKMNERTTFL